ncbi:MAG: cation:proton antiporter [Candidatus Nanosalina sp.]
MATGFESLAFLIGAATLLGILAQKTRQPKVIAYILAGLVIGPVGLGIASGTEMTSILSELGLVFLLFLIGLEINLEEVREVLRPTLGIGIIQMALTFAAGLTTAALLGFDIMTSLFIGAAVMFSSTALVVKMLTSLDESSTLPGRLDIGILLVQDVAVVFILALMTANFSSPLQIGVRALEILLLVSVIGVVSIASSRYFFSRILKQISDNDLAFFTHGVAWALVFISAASYLNLSMEIGAFVAGLGLAQLPYSRELQERVRPLTDLFMAIFFLNFGIGITGDALYMYFWEALAASVILMIAKFLIFFLTIDRFKFTPETSFTASVNMTQISEFGLILTSLAISEGFIQQEISGFISMVAILTMGGSSYMIRYKDTLRKNLETFLKLFESEEKNDIDIDSLEDHVVVVGYDKISRQACRKLSEDYDVLVVDKNPENTEELAKSDYRFIFGDFKHGEIREGVNLEKASFVLSFSDEKTVNTRILEDRNPETVVIAKAAEFHDASELYDLGADYVILENILAGNRIGEYIELYLEDRELFLDEVKSELDHIKGDEGSQS